MTVIITAGMIGVGKTTLTEILSKHLGTVPFYEPVKTNPLLELFYQDRLRVDRVLQALEKDPDNELLKEQTHNQYAFSLQIYFLTQRFKMIKKALADDNNILDRSIYEDALFTRINYEDGGISKPEYDIYLQLVDEMMEEINATAKQRPDLLVMLDAPFETILERIKKRGRPGEQIENNPDQEKYYRRLYDEYEKWYEDYDISPKIKIDLGMFDLSKKVNQKEVLRVIDEKLKSIR